MKTRSIARSCPATGGGQAGSVASAAPADQVPAPYGPASPTGTEGVDGKIRGLAPAGPLHTSGAGSHAAGLSERSAAHGARVKRLEEAILEVVKLAPTAHAGRDPGPAGLRGVAHISAVTIASELGNISSRFESARKLMGYSGVFPSEDSSGKRKRQGSITKAGNAHLRRIVVESAWCYRHRPSVGARLRGRQEGVPAEITEIAWKAQNRLHKRYMKLMAGQGSEKGHDRDRT
jgi:transposase